MRVLLDTHALLWWFVDDPRLSKRFAEILDDKTSIVHVSAATAWEIATKHRAGRLPQADGLVGHLGDLLRQWHFEPLSVSVAHGERAGRLIASHRDPFDRMLAAQAIEEDLTVLTIDPQLAALGARVSW